ncbi:MAG: HAD hydrolase family protein, partial [Gemmiger sp.]
VPPEEEAEFLRHLPGAKAVRWCPYFADIVPADGGKPVGVRAVCEHYGIALADTMAFGDGGNDADMLRCAGVGVALGNGDEAAKRAADYITDDVDADGVYNALRHFGVLE